MPIRSQPLTVRVVYVVPIDAEPWPEAKQRATEALEEIQRFFADEMDRLGHGPKTFQIARDDSGALVFHQFNSSNTKKEFEEDPIKSCLRATGEELRRAEDAVVYFYESCSITNGTVSGAGAKCTRSKAFLGSLHLKMARKEWIDNEMGYEGEVFDWISPETLLDDTLSWNRRGKKLGDVAGSAFGVMAHELAHCFGLDDHATDQDDVRERRGNLMGKGFRGMRGYFRPDLTADRCVLSEQSAEKLDKSPFFTVRLS